MNGIKGLIIKEFYLRRKTFFSGLGTFFLMFILGVSLCLSRDYGNLKNSENFSPEIPMIVAYAVSGIGIMLFTQNSETITRDVKCKWNIFEYTLPLSEQKLAAVRICTICAENLLGAVICTGFGSVIFVLSHQRLTAAYFANIAAIALVVFVVCIVSNFMFLKYKDPQKAATRFMVLIFGLYAVIAVFIFSQMRNIQNMFAGMTEDEASDMLAEKYLKIMAEWRDRLFPFTPLFYAALAVIGYFLFWGQYKRREK